MSKSEMEQATDGAETAAINGLVSSWSENISVSFCLQAPRYGLTLWCALGHLVGGAIQVPQLQLQLQFRLNISQLISWTERESERKRELKTRTPITRSMIISQCRSWFSIFGGGQRRSEGCGGGGAGRTRRHLLWGGKLAKIVKKNSREISDCKFHMFASAIKTRCSAIAERPRCRVRYSFRQK